jgi:hypothetical protein
LPNKTGVSKATVADTQKVVQIISVDKAKAAHFCEMIKLDEQIGKATKGRIWNSKSRGTR